MILPPGDYCSFNNIVVMLPLILDCKDIAEKI